MFQTTYESPFFKVHAATVHLEWKHCVDLDEKGIKYINVTDAAITAYDNDTNEVISVRPPFTANKNNTPNYDTIKNLTIRVEVDRDGTYYCVECVQPPYVLNGDCLSVDEGESVTIPEGCSVLLMEGDVSIDGTAFNKGSFYENHQEERTLHAFEQSVYCLIWIDGYYPKPKEPYVT